jgi:hypothetical protein
MSILDYITRENFELYLLQNLFKEHPDRMTMLSLTILVRCMLFPNVVDPERECAYFSGIVEEDLWEYSATHYWCRHGRRPCGSHTKILLTHLTSHSDGDDKLIRLIHFLGDENGEKLGPQLGIDHTQDKWMNHDWYQLKEPASLMDTGCSITECLKKIADNTMLDTYYSDHLLAMFAYACGDEYERTLEKSNGEKYIGFIM